MKLTKKAFTLVLVLALVVGVATGALATGAAQQITATLDPGVSVQYNGVTQTMTDANGAAVYPILYEGTTYISVRAVGTIFGVGVDWDAPNRAVLLSGSASGGSGSGSGSTGGGTDNSGGTVTAPEESKPASVNLAAVMGSGVRGTVKIAEAGELTVTDAQGQTYSAEAGLSFDIWNGSGSMTNPSRFYRHDVEGYSTLSVTVWSDVACEVRLVDGDNGVIYSFEVEADTLTAKEITLSGQSQLTFGAVTQSMTGRGTVKFLDPIVQ